MTEMTDNSLYLKIMQGVECCQFGDEEDIRCGKCPYLEYGCGEKLKEDLFRFLNFFSTVDGWVEALNLKRFVSNQSE